MLTLLTMTGNRPDAWVICQRLMAAQNYTGPVRWIIVDDGQQAQPVTFERPSWQLHIVRPTPHWQPGQNTQARNILAGLDHVSPHDRLVIIEDDDHYAPGYLTAISGWLNQADLVGESHAVYYNVKSRRWANCNNTAHASLCSTALKGAAIELLRRTAQGHHTFIDMMLWQRWTGTRYLSPTNLCVGIKGLPGRAGIGAGHRLQGRHDSHGAKLAQLLGTDCDLYAQFAGA